MPKKDPNWLGIYELTFVDRCNYSRVFPPILVLFMYSLAVMQISRQVGRWIYRGAYITSQQLIIF